MQPPWWTAAELARIEQIFATTETAVFAGDPMRFTSHGIWLPSPIPVLAAVLRAAADSGLFTSSGPRLEILDAGSGDGRILVLLDRLSAHGPALRLHGIETSAELHRAALDNLARMVAEGLVRHPERIHFRHGDYTRIGNHREPGIEAMDVVLNYPDGNEEAIARAIARVGTGAHLALLSPDRSLRISGLPLLWQRDVGVPPVTWRLSVHVGARAVPGMDSDHR